VSALTGQARYKVAKEAERIDSERLVSNFDKLAKYQEERNHRIYK
jgi:hypothetical protein